MKNTDPRVDDYIENAAEFAQPILIRIRELFHKAFPEIEENIKWSSPTFEHNGIVGGMSAFKKHVSFGFWRGDEMKDPQGLFEGAECGGSIMTLKYTDVSQLPGVRVMTSYIKEAVKLNQQPRPRKKAAAKRSKSELTVPEDLLAALGKNRKAKQTFDSFSYSNQKEYIEWITEAKRDATREKRLAQAIEWMAEGKPRNWKYMNC